MTQLSIQVSVAAAVRALTDYPRRFVEIVGPVIHRIVLQMARKARDKAPKAFSTLTQAINSIMAGPLEGRVVAGVNYARMVEDGTGIYGQARRASRKRPPVNAIEDWIRVRRIQPNNPDMSTRDLAWLIANRIAATGTPRQPFMEPTYNEDRDRAERDIYEAIARVSA